MAATAMARRMPRRAHGFTLIELIVALAVLSVASWVIIALFTASMSMGERARDERIAAEIAGETLADICGAPRFYRWGTEDQPRTTLFPVIPANTPEAEPQPVEPPATQPAERRASTHVRAEYGQFSWQAYGRLPNENAAYYEVTVVVRWDDAGKERTLALTRTLARQAVEESA